jgi:hypothetical protein
MQSHRLSCFGSSAIWLLLAAACSGGQTGDLSGKGDRSDQKAGHENTGGCEEHRAEVSFDEETEVGSAEALLRYAERTFDSPLSWKSAASGQAWSVGPESGEGTLHVTVERGAKAYVLTYTPEEDDSGRELAAIGVQCPEARLGVEATVSVKTDDGALDESFDTVLRSEVPGVAMLNVPFDIDDLNGALSVTSSNASAELLQLGLDAMLTGAGTTGSISGLEQVTHGSGPNDAVSASPAVLAVWPGGDACDAGKGLDVALSDDVLGGNGESALAAVTPATPVDISWRDGTATTLEVGIASSGAGCFRVDPSPVPELGGPVTEYPVTISLRSADGRLDGTYSGQVRAQIGNGRRQVLASVERALSAAEVAESGFASVKPPADTESLYLQIEAQESGGFVRLTALGPSPCAEQASSGSQGSGTPGCAGASRTEVEAASWAD